VLLEPVGDIQVNLHFFAFFHLSESFDVTAYPIWR
jgi:hypothetical protein